MAGTSRFFVQWLGLALLLLVPVGAAGATAAAGDRDAITDVADALAPGEYIWRGNRKTSGPVEIVISLPLQRAYVYRDGTLIGKSTISSGRRGYESPIGRFPILQKRQVHHSNRYDNAPMPFMQRLNWHGVALHGGHVPGYPASHGCIRLPMGFARRLYAVTGLGDVVFVLDEPVDSAETALEQARASA
jgi:lipoprotein-anchoring transpeptidase ErfK/SrfK